MSKKRIAFIGTGGTIASIGVGPLDTVNYGANGQMMHPQTGQPLVRRTDCLQQRGGGGGVVPGGNPFGMPRGGTR